LDIQYIENICEQSTTNVQYMLSKNIPQMDDSSKFYKWSFFLAFQTFDMMKICPCHAHKTVYIIHNRQQHRLHFEAAGVAGHLSHMLDHCSLRCVYW
jgi:hypothetical protein